MKKVIVTSLMVGLFSFAAFANEPAKTTTPAPTPTEVVGISTEKDCTTDKNGKKTENIWKDGKCWTTTAAKSAK